MEDPSSSNIFKRVYCFRNWNRNTECRKGILKLRNDKESGTSKERKEILNVNVIPSVLFPTTRGPASYFRASGHPVAVTRFLLTGTKGIPNTNCKWHVHRILGFLSTTARNDQNPEAGAPPPHRGWVAQKKCDAGLQFVMQSMYNVGLTMG